MWLKKHGQRTYTINKTKWRTCSGRRNKSDGQRRRLPEGDCIDRLPWELGGFEKKQSNYTMSMKQKIGVYEQKRGALAPPLVKD